jgi:hypothetical protein
MLTYWTKNNISAVFRQADFPIDTSSSSDATVLFHIVIILWYALGRESIIYIQFINIGYQPQGMAQTADPVTLSHADERILNQVFDPESSPEAVTVPIDASLPADPHITDIALLKELRQRELKAVLLVEQHSQKPQLTSFTANPDEELNQGKDQVFSQAYDILSSIISQHPQYASAYNNRAQLQRWRHGDSLMSTNNSAKLQSSLEQVIADLRHAIRLSSPAATNAAISPQQAKLLIQSWTQLGAVFWSLGRRKQGFDKVENTEESEVHQVSNNLDWSTWDAMRLEEEGSRCFFMAGTYGSDVGRSLAVKTNPYARLCGGIVKEALKREGTI